MQPSVDFSTYFWPSELELYLIRAAIGKDEDKVLNNFSKWANCQGFIPSNLLKGHVLPQIYDQLEDGSKKLLPLVYSNFRRLHITHPIVDQFVSFHRYTTYRNRMLANQMDLILEELNTNQVPYYIRKGLAYLPLYYEDYGARPTNDIDIVLNPEDINAFLLRRSSEGWQSTIDWKLNPIIYALNHAITLEKNHFELDVHWRFGQHTIDQTWNQLIMESAKVYGKMRTLSHEYHLVDSLLHGFSYNSIRPIRWVCDAHRIMHGRDIDWNLIINFTEGNEHGIPILSGLKYLQKQGFADVPENVIEKLENIPTRKYVIEYYKSRSGILGKHTKFRNIFIMFYYSRYGSKNIFIAFKKLLNHYRLYWSQSSNFQLLVYVTLILLEKVLLKKKVFLKDTRSK